MRPHFMLLLAASVVPVMAAPRDDLMPLLAERLTANPELPSLCAVANFLVNVLKVGLLPDFPDLPDGETSPRRIALLVNHHGDEAVKSIVAFLAPFANARISEIPEADTARFWLENRTE